MPKNKGKGGKNRRRGKNENDVLKRELIEKDGDNQAYAQVIKMLGNGRLMAFCFDGKSRLCHIRGKLRKKVWINTGDIILVGLREYQDDKADVILKYTPDEARVLKNAGQLPDNAKLNEVGDEQNEGEVEFIDSNDKDFEADEVEAQNRNYIISDSDSDSDEDSDESADDDAENGSGTEAPPSKFSVKDKRAKVAEQKKDSDKDGSTSESEEEDLELAAERGNYHKPGARDQKKRKGKRGK